jgi:hypothetical protein
MTRVALLLMLALLPQEGSRTIPPCDSGSECKGHETQPRWCQNYDGDGYRPNCSCKRDCSDPEQERHRETGCKTYCRTQRCKCDHGCPRT